MCEVPLAVDTATNRPSGDQLTSRAWVDAPSRRCRRSSFLRCLRAEAGHGDRSECNLHRAGRRFRRERVAEGRLPDEWHRCAKYPWQLTRRRIGRPGTSSLLAHFLRCLRAEAGHGDRSECNLHRAGRRFRRERVAPIPTRDAQRRQSIAVDDMRAKVSLEQWKAACRMNGIDVRSTLGSWSECNLHRAGRRFRRERVAPIPTRARHHLGPCARSEMCEVPLAVDTATNRPSGDQLTSRAWAEVMPRSSRYRCTLWPACRQQRYSAAVEHFSAGIGASSLACDSWRGWWTSIRCGPPLGKAFFLGETGRGGDRVWYEGDPS
jgi:hypothetical protein